MSYITIADLSRHFPEIDDVRATLTAGGVKPERTNLFDPSQDEFWLTSAADVLLDAIDQQREAAAEESKQEVLDQLHQRADEIRSYSGRARGSDGGGGVVSFT